MCVSECITANLRLGLPHSCWCYFWVGPFLYWHLRMRRVPSSILIPAMRSGFRETLQQWLALVSRLARIEWLWHWLWRVLSSEFVVSSGVCVASAPYCSINPIRWTLNEHFTILFLILHPSIAMIGNTSAVVRTESSKEPSVSKCSLIQPFQRLVPNCSTVAAKTVATLILAQKKWCDLWIWGPKLARKVVTYMYSRSISTWKQIQHAA